MSVVIFEKDYEGFESLYDLEEDILRVTDPRFNGLAIVVPEEFRGTIRVRIEYIPTEDK